LRKYIFHLDYRPDADKKSFVLWAEIFDIEKKINKIATKDDLSQIFEDYLPDLLSDEQSKKLNFDSLAFYIPHLNVINNSNKENIGTSIYQILSKFKEINPEIELIEKQISFNKKFIDVYSLHFSLFPKFRYELSKVLTFNKNKDVFSKENAIILSNNYLYYESMFMFLDKDIIKKEYYLPGYKSKHYSEFIKNYDSEEYEFDNELDDEESNDININDSMFEFCFFPKFSSKREKLILTEFIKTIPQISLYSTGNKLFLKDRIHLENDSKKENVKKYEMQFYFAQGFVNSLLFEILNVMIFNKIEKYLSIEQLKKINSVHPMIEVDLKNNSFISSLNYGSNRGRGQKSKNSEIIMSLIRDKDYQNWKKWSKILFSDYRFVIIIDRKDSDSIIEMSNKEDIKDWIIDLGIVNKKNGRTIKIEHILNQENDESNTKTNKKNKEKYYFYKLFITNRILKASGLSSTIRIIAEKIISFNNNINSRNEFDTEIVDNSTFSLELTKLDLLFFLKNETGILYKNDIRINYPKNWKKAKKVEVSLSFEQRKSRMASSTSQLTKRSALLILCLPSSSSNIILLYFILLELFSSGFFNEFSIAILRSSKESILIEISSSISFISGVNLLLVLSILNVIIGLSKALNSAIIELVSPIKTSANSKYI